MFLVVSDDLHSLTSKELEYISKIVLLREFENCIDLLWDGLPIRTDSEHDIAYSHSNLAERHAPDNIFTKKARKRITANNSTLRERAAATAVCAAMKIKTKIGMGLKTRKKSK